MWCVRERLLLCIELHNNAPNTLRKEEEEEKQPIEFPMLNCCMLFVTIHPVLLFTSSHWFAKIHSLRFFFSSALEYSFFPWTFSIARAHICDEPFKCFSLAPFFVFERGILLFLFGFEHCFFFFFGFGLRLLMSESFVSFLLDWFDFQIKFQMYRFTQKPKWNAITHT